MEKNVTIIFEKPRTVIFEEREVPSPNPGQLLIQTKLTMISTGTEMSVLDRKDDTGKAWQSYAQFPFVPGYNNIGIVVDVGEGVGKDWIGKKVGTLGAHAQYVLEDEKNARIIHRDISDEKAVYFTLAEIVMQSIRMGKVTFGEQIGIYGAGLLGQLAAQYCRICGARPVFVMDISDYRLSLLPKDAGIVPINSARQNVKEAVLEVNRGRLLDAVYEVTGAPELIPEELTALKNQGRFVILSSPRGKTLFDFHDLCNAPSFNIIGAHNYAHTPIETPQNQWTSHRDAELFFDYVADGELDVDCLTSNKVNYTEAVSMYDMLLNDRTKAMGVLLEWD